MAYTFKHGDRPIDGYTIQRAVGRGGFGEVYYAVSDGGREVALKYLRDNPQIELRGVSHCINLKSPHLVAIFDVKQTADGEYAIIMEYCSGPSLRDLLIAEPNGFKPQKAAFFVREIAKGLSYLHDRGIVHRDLKPGNLFYDDGYVKIGDYGLSKFISVSRHSAQTASVGTVHYMAPEIGSGNYSRGVDIYALGVMLYEMLLGKVPFEGSSMAEVLMKHLTTQPELDALPQPFGKVIRKALEKDPKDRYQTVDEMVDELLEVDEIRESVAGFSPQSLEGAVRHGPMEQHHSPMPSPNPPPGYARQGAQPPFAQPLGDPRELSHRLNRKLNRITRKIEKKMTKLGGGARATAPTPALHGADTEKVDRKKRIALSGLLSIGLAVGLGVLIANGSGIEEVGAAAGLSVIALAGSITLSRKAVRWFGVSAGPAWSGQLIKLCCCGPMLAVGSVPLLDTPRYSEEGFILWLGLLALAVFGNWDKEINSASGGEIRFGTAIWSGFAALILTAIAGGVTDTDPENILFVSAGVAAAASLILQATAWWAPQTAGFRSGGNAKTPVDPAMQPDSEGRTPPPIPGSLVFSADLSSDKHRPQTYAEPSLVRNPLERLFIVRAFWSVLAFALASGTIVTFLIPLVVVNMPYSDVTVAIVACTTCAAFTIFALRKTTPLKREGFWRETLRPFMLSALLATIGGTITGIAREWDRHTEMGQGLPDEARVAMLSGLIFSAIGWVALTAFTGRRRKAPQPFLQQASSQRTGEDRVGPADAKPVEM